MCVCVGGRERERETDMLGGQTGFHFVGLVGGGGGSLNGTEVGLGHLDP